MHAFSLRHYSEAGMIAQDVVLDLLECLKVLKKVVLKNSVKFMFEGGEEGSLLKGVHALVDPLGRPVDVAEVVDSECIEDVEHARDDLGLVQVGVAPLVLSAHGSLRVVVVPDVGAFESARDRGQRGWREGW